MQAPHVIDIARRHRQSWQASQPFVLGLLGDYSQRTKEELTPLNERRFRNVSLDSFDRVMAAVSPIARFELVDPSRADARVALEIEFRALADFEPDALLRRVPLLTERLRALPTAGPERAQSVKALQSLLNDVLHAEPVRRLEASWRSVHRLLRTLPDLPRLRIRLLDLSEPELTRMLRHYRGVAWSESPLSHLLIRDQLLAWGGEPFSLLIADYAFSHASQDVRYLADLGQIAKAAGCIVLTAASPSLLNLGSYEYAETLREVPGELETSAYSGWRELRDSDPGSRLALALPRVLARAPHRCQLAALDGALFVEDDRTAKLPWANAAYAVGARLFADFALRAGYAGLPDAATGGIFDAEHLTVAGLALEGRFNAVVSEQLMAAGFVLLQQSEGSPHLRYVAAQSIAAERGGYLAWRMLCGRLMYGLRDLLRQLRGCAWRVEEFEQAMHEWLQGFVDASASDPTRRLQYPLAAASVRVDIEELQTFDETGLWSALPVELQIAMHPLRPGREERCSVRAVLAADGGSER